MTQKERANKIREMAKGADIHPLWKKRIAERPNKDILYFYSECKTVQDLEAKCRAMEEICEKNRALLEGIGITINFKEG